MNAQDTIAKFTKSVLDEIAHDPDLRHCTTVTQLHEHCDANMLGGLGDWFAGQPAGEEAMERSCAIANAVWVCVEASLPVAPRRFPVTVRWPEDDSLTHQIWTAGDIYRDCWFTLDEVRRLMDILRDEGGLGSIHIATGAVIYFHPDGRSENAKIDLENGTYDMSMVGIDWEPATK